MKKIPTVNNIYINACLIDQTSVHPTHLFMGLYISYAIPLFVVVHVPRAEKGKYSEQDCNFPPLDVPRSYISDSK